ncbi:sortase [Candidatus Beckwithbacteria bacterium]|nr:sortase [Candidatus Beckwithbacteria bacterium]
MFGKEHFKPYRYVRLKVKAKKNKDFHYYKPFISALAYFCFFTSFFGLIFLASPLIIAQSIVFLQKINKNLISYAGNQNTTVVNVSSQTLTPKVDLASQPFFIKIPKINVDAKVFPNIDPFDKTSYEPALSQGVAHATGSAFPGEEKMIYIFGHSTDYDWNVARYNALFYQLKDLEIGDEVSLTLGEKTFQYQVADKQIVEANDFSLFSQNKEQNVLILQTCYPPGTTWKRLLILAKFIGD